MSFEYEIAHKRRYRVSHLDAEELHPLRDRNAQSSNRVVVGEAAEVQRLVVQGEGRRAHRAAEGGGAEPERKRSGVEFSLCLSRACLGKINDRFYIAYKWLEKDRFCSPDGGAHGVDNLAVNQHLQQKTQQRHSLSQLSLYLSRACLGKSIVLSSYKMAHKRDVSSTSARTE